MIMVLSSSPKFENPSACVDEDELLVIVVNHYYLFRAALCHASAPDFGCGQEKVFFSTGTAPTSLQEGGAEGRRNIFIVASLQQIHHVRISSPKDQK
jgi:hypothetical protein